MMDRTDTETDIDAILLTHAHADHADYISFLNENIPIYMGDTCKLLLEAIEGRTARSFEREILSFKPRPLVRTDEPIERTVNTFRTGDKFKIGSLEVEPIHVDHSVPGAIWIHYLYVIRSCCVYWRHSTSRNKTRDDSGLCKKGNRGKANRIIS